MMAVNVRYIVDDLDSAIAFYSGSLGFRVERHPGPGFAMLSRGELRLLAEQRRRIRGSRAGDAGRTPTRARGLEPHPAGGRRPRPGGSDPAARRARFRNDIVVGNGGRQILVEDPAGNPIELFEPRRE
jgi:catechol 2,3-dioxygenase-like lactoylglutathione lyase family enzyme